MDWKGSNLNALYKGRNQQINDNGVKRITVTRAKLNIPPPPSTFSIKANKHPRKLTNNVMT